MAAVAQDTAAASTTSATSETALIQLMVLDNLSTSNTRATRLAAAAALPPILRPAAQQIRQLWATRTWNTRASLLLRAQDFARHHRLQHLPLGVQMTAFVANLQVAPSTRANYASALGSTARRMGMQVPMLELFRAAANAVGPTTPTRQAVPATRLQIFVLINAALRSKNNRLAVGIFLCWKTASRWADVMMLKQASFLNLHTAAADNFLVVQWGATKTNRKQEFRPDSWTVVVEEDPELRWLTSSVVDTITSLPRGHLLVDTTTDQLRRFMRAQERTAELTAHSIKRGAVNLLVDAAVEGRLSDPRLIPLLAKHKDQLHAFPSTTLRYVEDKVKLALMLGTQNATRLL